MVNFHQYGTTHLYLLFINLGDPNDCNNYRGISVTSCLGKLFTSLLQKRLGDILESKKLISFNQGGFRGGYRTTDHIYRFKK